MIFLGVALAALALLFIQYRATKQLRREVEETKGATFVAAEGAAQAAGKSTADVADGMLQQEHDQED